MPRQTVRYVIAGRVQGVGYRYFVARMAEAFDIAGRVRNCADGSVEIVASGLPENLRAFREQVELGPEGSRVDHVLAQPAAEERFAGFSIVR